MPVGARKDIHGQAQLGIEDHQGFAGQRPRSGGAQRLEAMLARGQTVAVQVFQPVTRQLRRPCTVHRLDQRLGLVRDVPHQTLRGPQLDPAQLGIDRDDRGGDLGVAVGRVHARPGATHDLQHQLHQRGEQDLARVLGLCHGRKPSVQGFGIEQVLKQTAHHHRRRALLNELLQNVAKHDRTKPQGISTISVGYRIL